MSGELPRKTWEIDGLTIVRRVDLRPDEREEKSPVDPYIGRWLDSALYWDVLTDMLRHSVGAWMLGGISEEQEVRDALRAGILDAFRRRLLVVLREERMRFSPAGENDAGTQSDFLPHKKKEPPPKQPPLPEKTWVEFRLVDQNGDPVEGATYRLKITDGSIRQGTLGADGRVRVSNIDPGTCEISFLSYDAREWKRR